MPGPKKSESKQDFLRRCTQEKVKTGMKKEKAFASCEADWTAVKGKHEPSREQLEIKCALDLKNAEVISEESGKEITSKPFMITAYTGEIFKMWWGDVVIEVKGISALPKFPILRDHMTSQIAGIGEGAFAQDGKYFVPGKITSKTEDGEKIITLDDEGFPWQASVYVLPVEILVLKDEKQTAKVNGSTVQGPIEIWKKTMLKECSICVFGRDDNTAFVTLTSESGMDGHPVKVQENGGNKMPMTKEELKAQEPELYKEIYADGAGSVDLKETEEENLKLGADKERERVSEILAIENVDDSLKQKAISDGLSASEAKAMFFEEITKKGKTELDKVKASLPGAVPPAGSEKGGEKKELTAEIEAYQKEMKCSYSDAAKAIVSRNPDAYEEANKRRLEVKRISS